MTQQTEQNSWARKATPDGHGVDYRYHYRDEGKMAACGANPLASKGFSNPYEARQGIFGDFWYGVCKKCLRAWTPNSEEQQTQ